MLNTIKQFAIAALLFVGLVFAPQSSAQALSGSQHNVTIQAPPTYLCVPVDSNGPAATIPYTCTGFGSILQNSTTFTTLTVTVNRPVVGAQQIAVAVEDFTTGNNVAACAITATQKTCEITFSFYVASGDALAVKIYNNITGPAYYNLDSISWVIQ